MAQPEDQEKPLPDAARHLGLELEQARVALEDAHAEVAALAEDNQALRQSLERAEAARIVAQQAALRSRNDAARSSELITKSLATIAEEQELRVALEEASVLAEELREANDALGRL